MDATAWLAQSVEHETLNLRVVGSSPTLGEFFVGYFFLTLTVRIEIEILEFSILPYQKKKNSD